MKIAVMQPYFFPYIGYFQMISAVDKFILYDDVNYIKGGWINRNHILQNKEKKLITLNLIGPSSNKLINEILVGNNSNKLLKTIKQSYSKATYFKDVFPLIKDVLTLQSLSVSISDIAGKSIIEVSKYLGINTVFEYSSKLYADSKGMDKADRLIEICKGNNADTYINAIGGTELYSKEYFKRKEIDLFFINSQIRTYKQFNNEFVPYLSIIDVLMFNSKEEIKKMLYEFELL